MTETTETDLVVPDAVVDAVRGARLGRQWCDHGADGEREAYREGFPQGAHISPSCCV